MQSKSNINEEMEFVKNLKIISQAYQEISVMRIQRIRTKVLQTRLFVDSIQDVFRNVKESYKKKITGILKNSKKNKKNIKNYEEKEVVVFISANSKLYGDIVSEVFKDFIKYVKKHDSEVMIVGKLGRELWNEVFPKREILYADFTDKEIQSDQLSKITEPLSKFTKINVFHGKYESIVNQSPTLTNITGDAVDELESVGVQNFEPLHNNQTKKYFLFEPSIEELASFFETQVIAALLKQSVHESELSLHASRIKAMELALQTMEKKEKELHLEDLRFRSKMYNKNQQTALLGVSIWKK